MADLGILGNPLPIKTCSHSWGDCPKTMKENIKKKINEQLFTNSFRTQLNAIISHYESLLLIVFWFSLRPKGQVHIRHAKEE